MEWLKYYKQNNQRELSLTGMGESLMHPYFVEYLARARDVMGNDPIIIATNGLLLSNELAKAIAPYKPKLYISLHRPEKAGPAIEIAKKYGLLESVNAQFAYNSINWAGQVDWANSASKSVCKDLLRGRASVLVNGDIITCCMDAHGKHVIGNIFTSNYCNLETNETKLCKHCHHSVPEESVCLA